MDKSASLTDVVSTACAHDDTYAEGSFAFHEHVRSKPADEVRDYLIHKDGLTYAGSHLLIDYWGASRLNDPDLMEKALCEAAETAGATVLHVHVHEFGGGGGVSGVAVLAESHISVHTWPELDYAAFDVFMCGNCEPARAEKVLNSYFKPARKEVSEQKRGIVD